MACTIGTYTRIYNALLPIVPYFGAFTVSPPAVPSEYWNVYSQEERIKWLACNVKKLIEYSDLLASSLNETDDELEKLYQEFEKFKASGFDDYYADQIEQWVRDNLAFLFTTLAKQVFFGLTSTGYFCAYIPESWSDITFDTGMNYGQFDYGRLILRFTADGSGVIDNTGRYDDSIAGKVSDLERRVARNETTLYTLLNEGG